MKHFIYTPFTGRGKSNKGNEWLKKRIEVFKEFTLKSLLQQTNRNFTHWIGWCGKDKNNKLVQELDEYLEYIKYPHVFTYGGLAIWDDRKQQEKRDLPRRLDKIIKDLTCEVQGVDLIYQTFLDSDDMYFNGVVEEIQNEEFEYKKAVGYKNGYVMNYSTLDIAEWNPITNPPFYTIMYPQEVFVDPIKHIEYTGAYKSHENVVETMNFKELTGRKYIVGIHNNNIRTPWNHRFRGKRL